MAKVTVYSTKYALSTGIKKEEGVEINGNFACRNVGHCMSRDYLHLKMGKDAFLSEEEAKVRAVQMAKVRRENLKKEDQKLARLIQEWGL